MQRIKISKLRFGDVKEAASIVRKNYSKQYEKLASNELKEMFSSSSNRPIYFVAKHNKEVVGFAGYIQSWMDYSIYEIFWVNVLPEKQKKGIGRMLVSKIIGEIKKKKNSRTILLSANHTVGNSSYYKQQFGFRAVFKFGNRYHLMALLLK